MPRSANRISTIASLLLAACFTLSSTLTATAENTTEQTPAPSVGSPASAQLAPPPVGHRTRSNSAAGTHGLEAGSARSRHGLNPSGAARNDRFQTASEGDPSDEPSVYGAVWESYSGDDVENVDVTIWPRNDINNEPAATAITNAYGEYSLGTLPPGDYLLRFSADGYITQWWKAADSVWTATTITVVEGGQPLVANVELDHSETITGTVTTAKGKPVPVHQVALLVWSTADKDWAIWNYNTTDNTGHFIFIQVPPGLYAVVGVQLPKDARLKAEAHYVSLLSYSGTKNGGALEPWVVGAPGVGLVQKVDVGSGSWKKTTFSYQWLRNGVKIAKATKKTYTPTTADLHMQLQVRVTSRQGNNTFTVTSPTTWPLLRNSVPRVGGTLAVGAEATADAGAWETASVQSYQWYADGKAIAGATSSTLVLGAAQKGKKLTVTVTGKYYNFPTISRTSAPTAKVATAGIPIVSGSPVVGTTLKAKAGTWTKKTKFSYQWLRNGVAIRKATKSSYKLAAKDAGAAISVRVTGKLSGYATISTTSGSLTVST